MARWDDARAEHLWSHYRMVLKAVDGMPFVDALACLTVAIILIAKATDTSILTCLNTMVDLWHDSEEEPPETPASSVSEDGPITERMPRNLN